MKNLFKSRFFKITLILLVLGIVCFCLGLSDFIDSRKTPIDYNTAADGSLKKGDIVEGDIYYNYGVYETITTKENGRTTGTSYRYIIPIGEESYVGIHVNDDSTVDQMDKMTDETYDVMDGKADSTQTTVHFKGKVMKMTSEDYGYFKDFMKSGGFTDDEISKYGSELYIQIRPMNQGPGIMIFGLVLFLVGAVLIIVPIVQAKKASPQPQATYNQSFNDALSPSADATFNQTPNATLNQSTGATYNQDTTNIQGPENFQ